METGELSKFRALSGRWKSTFSSSYSCLSEMQAQGSQISQLNKRSQQSGFLLKSNYLFIY